MPSGARWSITPQTRCRSQPRPTCSASVDAAWTDQPLPPPPQEVAIKHRIDELYTAHPFYGSRKLTVLLEPDFAPLNRKPVQRYMREMGIAGISPGPNLSKRAAEHRVYPYLLRNVTAQAPNQIWGCDITYVRLRGQLAVSGRHSRLVFPLCHELGVG